MKSPTQSTWIRRLVRTTPLLGLSALAAVPFLSLNSDSPAGVPEARAEADSPPEPGSAVDASPAERLPTVRVEPVRDAPDTATHRYSGAIRAARTASASFVVGGRLEARPIEVGDSVEAGTLIGQLDPAPYEHATTQSKARVRELRSRLKQAKRDAKRAQRLLDAKATTAEEVEQRETAVSALRQSLAQAKAGRDESARALTETDLLAPLTGIVTAVHLEPGEFAAPGVPVATISGRDQLEVEVEVPEALVSHLERGQSVDLHFPLAKLPAQTGRIERIADAVAVRGRWFPVIVSVDADAPGTLAGMTVEVDFTVPKPKAVLLPTAALQATTPDATSVLVVRSGEIRRVPVAVRALSGDDVVAEGSVEAGDDVVVRGQIGLVDGSRVEVTR